MTACPQCGRQNEADARFCSACGTPIALADVRHEVRKTVTILFSDVTGSTALGETLDPETTRRLMAQYFETARHILERHGGTVEKFIGDAAMAVFGIPQVHEDDALRAVRAAIELREAVDELELRIGINTGEVVAGTGDTLVTGDAVNVAARLEQLAQPGEILIGEPTLRLVRDAVDVESVPPLDAKGKSQALVAHLLLGVREGAEPFARHLDSPLVGREREQRLLREAFERAVEERSSHLFTLLGAAGIGKSRLAQELVTQVAEHAMVLSGRCLPYGEGVTYWPLVEILRELGSESRVSQYLEGEPDAREIVNRVFAAVGFATEDVAAPEETFWAVRKLLEALARERPLVVVLDDLHWAEPTFLDLVEHLADWSREAPILLLCLARPELLDSRGAWGGGKLNATSLFLEPLSENETQALIDNLLTRLADETRTRIAEAAEGNPLFVEQMLAMLAEQVGLGAELEIPPTIQALLAARLDRLPPTERATLERAAVIGKEFSRAGIEELGGDARALQALIRKELIRPHRSLVSGDDAFRFRHLLVRDAAYDSIPKQLRAELHECLADWIERQRSEYDEIVGFHLEQASRYLDQLGVEEKRARELAQRAATRLGRAGKRAYARTDTPAVVGLLERATALLPADDPERLELLFALAGGLDVTGEPIRAQQMMAEVLERAAAGGDRVLEIRASIRLQSLRFWHSPEGATEELREVAEAAIRELERLGDDRALAEAWLALVLVHTSECRAEAMGLAAERALRHARQAEEHRLAQDARSQAAVAAAFGPMPIEAAIAHIEQSLADAATTRLDEAGFLSLLADLVSLRGDWDEAAGLALRSKERFHELGHSTSAAGSTMSTAWIPLRAGDPAAAEAELRPAHDALESIGEKGARCGVAAVLAEALYQQGRFDEAERFTRESEEAAASDDVLAQVWWRGVRAKVLARRGDFEHAVRLAREAVEIVEPSDWVLLKAWALFSFGEVLVLTGDGHEAAGPIHRALDLYETKGDVVDASRARRLLEDLQPTATP